MLLKIFVIVAVMSSCHCQLDQLCPNIGDDIKPCIATYIDPNSDLAGLFTDGASVLDAGRMLNSSSMSVMCNNKVPTENFYKCFYTKFLACIPSEWTKAFPSMDQVVDSISYLCDNRADVDWSCVTSNIQDVSPCVSSALTKMTGDLSTADGYVSLMCRVYPLMENCYRSVMSACPARTGEVLAEYIKYQRPAGCGATMVTFSLSLLVVSLCYTWLKNLI